ncbi:MAG: LacI family transcriptional regulator [Spirochaetia bacterium]|nr:LacI family transcriptional regulator [Spirochaetia bacterium]
MNKITISDVAKHAGVSKTSVSYVLSGSKRLSEDVEKRVMQAVDELGYTPPEPTRRLQKKAPKILNFCLPLEKGKISDDPYYIPLIEGAMEYAASEGYHVMITRLTQGDTAAEKMFYRSFDFADGVILCNLQQDHVYEQALIEHKIPYVVNGTPDSIDTKYFVDADIEGIGYKAAMYLLKKGHTHIHYINLAEHLVQSRQRLSGFKLAHEEYSIPWQDERHSFCNVSMQDAYELMKSILEKQNNKITAIVTSNEIQARGAVKALQEQGVDIPGSMAVVSMGGGNLAEIGHPKLTTIDFSPEKIGRESAKMLIEVIQRNRIRPSQLIVSGKLIEREST